MNIVFLSQMNSFGWNGPSYSVPNRVYAQSKFDNVFWYHLRKETKDEWYDFFDLKSLNDYPKGNIKDLPQPFNNPDLIVIEQFYGYGNQKIIKEIIKSKIPYVIVPRGELTKKAQNRKKFKKFLGNTLKFYKIAKKASSIQYLTEEEKQESGEFWNENSFVIPNGIDKKSTIKENFNSEKIVCTNIGRIEKYQKGLDILIEACGEIKEILKKNYVEIHLYGPDQENQKNILEQEIKNNSLEDIIYIHDPILGEEKKKILLKSDIFIMTSRFEGHPMALIEALSYGVPVIATTGTNMAKQISKTNSGWVSETSVEGIKMAISCMINEKKMLGEKGKNAYKLSEIYNWEYIAKKTHKEYTKIISSRR